MKLQGRHIEWTILRMPGTTGSGGTYIVPLDLKDHIRAWLYEQGARYTLAVENVTSPSDGAVYVHFADSAQALAFRLRWC
jgi:hypothetical protein